MNTNIAHPELTNKRGTYVEQLVAHNAEIERAYNNRSINVNQMKELVKNIILNTNQKDEEDKSPATKRFLMSLQKQKSKSAIITLVWNARLKGDNLGVV